MKVGIGLPNPIPGAPGRLLVDAFAGIGVDELMLDPTVADLSQVDRQVDRLADAVL